MAKDYPTADNRVGRQSDAQVGDEDERTDLGHGSVGLPSRWRSRAAVEVETALPTVRRTSWSQTAARMASPLWGVAHGLAVRPVLSGGLPSVPACDANLGQVSEGLRMMRREWTHSVELPNKALNPMGLRLGG